MKVHEMFVPVVEIYLIVIAMYRCYLEWSNLVEEGYAYWKL